MSVYKLSILFLILFVFSACKKENTPTSGGNGFEPSNTDSLLAEGQFVSKAHPTSGTVKLYQNDDEYILSISNLSSDNGPDLRVYLSDDENASNFSDLGSLQATSGDFSYTFNLSTDVQTQNHVLIWCEDFSINFGSAELN